MAIIFHLTKLADWEARNPNEGYVAPSLESEGFIHCSENQSQLFGVVHRLFAGETGLMALEVETDLLTSPLKREPSRSGEIYPHIYGPINPDAVVGARKVVTGDDGNLTLDGG